MASTTLLDALRQRVVWNRGLGVGLSVGALQILVNQGDAWLCEEITGGLVLKTILCPTIAVSVAVLSAASMYAEMSRFGRQKE